MVQLEVGMDDAAFGGLGVVLLCRVRAKSSIRVRTGIIVLLASWDISRTLESSFDRRNHLRRGKSTSPLRRVLLMSAHGLRQHVVDRIHIGGRFDTQALLTRRMVEQTIDMIG